MTQDQLLEWIEAHDGPFTMAEVQQVLPARMTSHAVGAVLRRLGYVNRQCWTRGPMYRKRIWMPAGPPRGPSTTPHIIPEGHELSGVSSFKKNGAVTGQWDKTRVAGADEPPQEVPEDHLINRTATYRRGDGSVVGQWTSTSANDQQREEAFREAWERHAALYAGLAERVPTPDIEWRDSLTVYPLGDPHIGMLAWEPETGDHFDTKIACRELLKCVQLLVESAPASERAIICNLGDFMHAQDDSSMTPGSGNRLDTDGRYSRSLDMGHALLRGIIDAALLKHKTVHIRNLPGNHDPRVAAELYYWLLAVYEKEPRVVCEKPFRDQQYDEFGSVLIGWHHGHRAKTRELPELMAYDMREAWGRTEHHIWHTGHIHHRTRQETPGCEVESHRTMAAADKWHAGKYRAGRSLDAITYDPIHGEVARATRSISMVRKALEGGA